MDEYIKRETLLKAISKVGGSPLSEWDTVGVVSLVANQPAADVAPVRRGTGSQLGSHLWENPWTAQNVDTELLLALAVAGTTAPTAARKWRCKMVDVEKRKKELHVILAELERDIETLQANISKLREDMDGVNTETDLAAFVEAHDLERGLKHIELYCGRGSYDD